MITKGERTELRSIVKGQFKVLRHEVEQRHAEMVADLDEQIAQRYAEVDGQRRALMWRSEEILQACSRELTDLFGGSGAVKGHDRAAEFGDLYGQLGPEVSIERPVRVGMEDVTWSKADRAQLRRAATERLAAQVKGAMLNLERREADLLRTLAVGAIESEEARSFLTGIPTVGELVPAARLSELEASFGDDLSLSPAFDDLIEDDESIDDDGSDDGHWGS